MAYEIPGFALSLIAASDLSSSQFCAVNVDANGKAALPSEGLRAIGVLQNKPKSGEVATIMVSGITKFKVGIAGVHAGNNVTVDDDGTALNASSGDRCIGIALKTNAAAEIGTVLLLNGGATVAGS